MRWSIPARDLAVEQIKSHADEQTYGSPCPCSFCCVARELLNRLDNHQPNADRWQLLTVMSGLKHEHHGCRLILRHVLQPLWRGDPDTACDLADHSIDKLMQGAKGVNGGGE